MAHFGSAIPAYGRDYTSARAVYDDFEAGKDFNLGSCTNKEDLLRMAPSGGSINIRYKQLREVCVIAWNAAGAVTLNGKRPSPKAPKKAKEPAPASS